MAAINHLESLRAPWVQLLPLKAGQSYDAVLTPPPGFVVRNIQGRRCGTKTGLLSEFARALEFPSYFGMNWDGLEECLTDLEWLPADGYLLVFKDSELILPDDEDGYSTLVNILQSVGKWWATEEGGHSEIPFHAIFTVSDEKKALRKRWGIPQLKPQITDEN
jgi:RNAse (barnase) inhibitor barstar